MMRKPAIGDAAKRRFDLGQTERVKSRGAIDIELRILLQRVLELNPDLRERDRLLRRADLLVEEGGGRA